MSLESELKKIVKEETNKAAEELKDAMKGIVHVRSGNLRDSITKHLDGETDFTVGVDADLLEAKDPHSTDYSVYYYYGHHSWPGHKFLEEALNSVN